MTGGDLHGQVAIVTGGAGHIGRAITSTLTERGASVVSADLIEAEGASTALSLICDVTDSSTVAATVVEAHTLHERIDILVNCAGGGARTGFVDLSDDDWFAELNKNLSGAFFFMRAVLPSMLAAESGAIVNISSISGIIGGLPAKGSDGRSGPAYAAAKAGLIGLTKWAAREYGSRGIRVNAIAPGPVLTSEVMQGYDYGVEDYPIPRMGQTGDMAETVAFLCSPAASYITGEVIKVSGGVGM
jgi:3-oxoacyl-[acyl-carrier protein] reductase